MPVVLDNSLLRIAAMSLVAEARRAIPRVNWAVHALDPGAGARLIVEVAIADDGPREVTLLLDAGGPTQTILCQLVQEGAPVREVAV